MRLVIDARFLKERSEYDYRHACEDCAFFEPRSGDCRHAWPNRLHRRAASEPPARELVLCKQFELA